MRVLVLLPFAMLAGCGGGETQNKAASAAPATIAAGQWELTSEVTTLSKLDSGTPKINTPAGTRTAASVCVGAGQAPTSLFSGDGYECRYDLYYVRNGLLNVTMTCTREGLSGSILMSADGEFQDGSLDFHRNVRTSLNGDGDVMIDAHVTGRRTGACTPTQSGAPGNRQGG